MSHTKKEKLPIMKLSQLTQILWLAFRENLCLRQMAFSIID